MNKQVAVVAKQKLHEVISMLTLVDTTDELITLAKAELIGLVAGLEIVITYDNKEEPQ